MDTRVLEVISSQITDQIAQIQEFLGTGQAKDYAEYRESCGKIRGLIVAKQQIEDLVRNLEQSDD
jgi:hypothetical protein